MKRQALTLKDFTQECTLSEGHYTLDKKPLGLKIFIPDELKKSPPFSASAYDYLQFLRKGIFEYGLIEFPGLPVNYSNYTLAQRSPKQHTYSSNPYLTGFCQDLHQDTPPYPTAFWLNQERQYSATWLTSIEGLEEYYQHKATNQHTTEDLHKELVPKSLVNQTGLLLNFQPGLILIDNSQHHHLYHARTCRFDNVDANPDHQEDTPMYAFNEVGLLNYIDQLDEHRGQHHRNQNEVMAVHEFIQQNPL